MGSLAVLRGSLAPQGAVVRQSTTPLYQFEGPARPFDSQEHALRAIEGGGVTAGDMVVVRYEGPHAGAIPQLSRVVEAINRSEDLKDNVALVTDARLPPNTTGLAVGHVSPEAADAGPLALVQPGDHIRLDLPEKRLDLEVDPRELADRREKWRRPHRRYRSGLLGLYTDLVSSASSGCWLA